MYKMKHLSPGSRTHGRQPHTSGVMSYRQIAEVLEELEGEPISADRVAHICREAEWKIVDAVEADPMLGKRFRSVLDVNTN